MLHDVLLAARRGWFAALAAGLVATAVHAAPGDPDLSFAGTGSTRLGFGHSDDVARAIVAQSDGKLVVAGYSALNTLGRGALALARYNTDQTLDTSFGTQGRVFTEVPASDGAIHAMALQSDGKIVVAGYLLGASSDWVVARYNVNGTLDTGFDTDGIVTTGFGGFDQANALAIQSDGKIVVVGHGNSGFAVARYNSNGSLDTSFDGDGKVVAAASNGAYAVMLQPDGRIVVAGGGGQFDLVRLLSTGALDTSFDVDGRVTTSVGTGGASVRALTMHIGDGTHSNPTRIVAAGTCTGPAGSSFALARYSLGGALDTGFGGTGTVVTNVTAGTDIIRSLRILSNINGPFAILAGGTVDGSATTGDFGVARYLLNGTLDTAFDFDGLAIASVGPGIDEGYASVLRGSSLIMAGATRVGPGNNDFAMVSRNITSGALDVGFDGDGMMTLDLRDRPASAGDVAIQSNGRILVAGVFHNGQDQDVALVRYLPDGTLDVSYGVNGKVQLATPSTHDNGGALAIQSDDKCILAGGIASNLVLLRFDTQGAVDPGFDAPQQAGVRAGAVALQPDGKVVVAGAFSNGSNDDFIVLRFLSDGSLDMSFGVNGRVTTAIGAGDDQAAGVAVQADGRILASGATAVGGTYDFALVRYLPNGTIDNSFGTFGRVITDLNAGTLDVALDLALQPDGKILLAGYTFDGVNPATADFALVRYNTNGSLDTSFDGDGKLTTGVGFDQDIGTCLALQSDGTIIVAGGSALFGQQDLTLVRYTTDGALDVTYGSNGKGAFDVGAVDFAWEMVLDAAGRALLVGESDGAFVVARVLGDDAVTDVPRPALGSPNAARISSVFPNPAFARQSFVVEVERDEPGLALSIYSVTGQRVYRRTLGEHSAGVHRIEWDGRTDNGDLASPGVYTARLEGTRRQPASEGRRVVRVR